MSEHTGRYLGGNLDIPAGIEKTYCPTCTQNQCSPFRSYDECGRIVAGCIDNFHTGHLTPISASNDWHNRPEAKRYRMAVKSHLKAVLV